MDYGATIAVTEPELQERMDLCELGPIKIGFDCVSGKSALTIMKHLVPSGIFVNYGGMSRQPITVPVKYLIFKDLRIRGFWLSGGRSEWNNDIENRKEICRQIADWMIDRKLKVAPYEMIPHTEWKTAISRSLFKDETPTNLPCKRILSFPKEK